MFSRLIVLQLLLASVVTLGACGGDSAPATSEMPDAMSNQINPMPREALRDGGTFTWPLQQMPTNFNYYQLDGTLSENFRVIASMMPTTYVTNAGGVPVWNRDLLASEPELKTDPKQIVIYRIRPEAVWYDGTPITWEDFHWQWKANSGTDARYQISSANGYSVIESVERGANDREVVVTYRERFADWQSIYNQFYPASTNKDPAIFNSGWINEPLTSAGPFRLASVNQTAKTITLVRNEKWWGSAAKLDTIVYRVINPDAQIDALANGEVDAMDIGPDANKYQRARSIANVDLRLAAGPNYRHITVNGTGPVLQDVRVRRAMAMGIDRATIAQAMLAPLGVDAKTLGNHILMSNLTGYKDNSADIGTYNPEGAKQLLDEAGWLLDGDVRKKDGKPLEVNFVIPATVLTSRQEAEMVQNMLAKIGMSVKISTVPLNDAFAKYITPGEFDLTAFSWIGTAYPISSAKSLYAKPTVRADGSVDVQQNYARVGSDEIDGLFDQANAELDRNRAIELINRADSLIWQEVHSLTTYQRPEIFAVKKGLANFGAFGFAIPWNYQDIGWVK